MFRSLGAMAHAIAPSRLAAGARLRVTVAGLAGVLIITLVAISFGRGAAIAAATCDSNATTSTFASQVSAAAAGDTICLASGDYGTWQGTNKAITITAQSGATPSMGFSFTTGDQGFTLDGLTLQGGSIVDGARDITIKNSRFTGLVLLDNLANSNILFDHNTHNNLNITSANNGRIKGVWTSSTPSGVTVRNSEFIGGNADGIQFGTGMTIENNVFKDITEGSCSECHTDPIQAVFADGGAQIVIRGNYFQRDADGIVAYDRIENALIEDNVVNGAGRWGGIEIYSGVNVTVRHNTLVYRQRNDGGNGDNGCAYAPCGQMIVDHKPADPVGSNIVVRDNIFTALGTNDGTGGAVSAAGNMVRSGSGGFVGIPTYVGGGNGDDKSDFALAAGSPGKGAATDGTDVGADVSGAASPSPTPTPTPTPTATPTVTPSPTPTPPGDVAADAIWTPPSGARVGTPVTFNGSASKGDAPLTCTWSFENQDGSTVYDTQTGCTVQRTFQTANTKYVELTVRDADGDTDSSKQSFAVGAAGAPSGDTPADAVWTAPRNVTAGTPVTLDATASRGDAPISCTWSFENEDGSIIWETLTGCELVKTFRVADTKYVRLIVRDADGDTDSNEQSFPVQ